MDPDAAGSARGRQKRDKRDRPVPIERPTRRGGRARCIGPQDAPQRLLGLPSTASGRATRTTLPTPAFARHIGNRAKIEPERRATVIDCSRSTAFGSFTNAPSKNMSAHRSLNGWKITMFLPGMRVAGFVPLERFHHQSTPARSAAGEAVRLVIDGHGGHAVGRRARREPALDGAGSRTPGSDDLRPDLSSYRRSEPWSRRRRASATPHYPLDRRVVAVTRTLAVVSMLGSRAVLRALT